MINDQNPMVMSALGAPSTASLGGEVGIGDRSRQARAERAGVMEIRGAHPPLVFGSLVIGH